MMIKTFRRDKNENEKVYLAVYSDGVSVEFFRVYATGFVGFADLYAFGGSAGDNRRAYGCADTRGHALAYSRADR